MVGILMFLYLRENQLLVEEGKLYMIGSIPSVSSSWNIELEFDLRFDLAREQDLRTDACCTRHGNAIRPHA